jgi:hypothetical protein
MEKHLGMATALWSLSVAEPVYRAVYINAWSLEIYSGYFGSWFKEVKSP